MLKLLFPSIVDLTIVLAVTIAFSLKIKSKTPEMEKSGFFLPAFILTFIIFPFRKMWKYFFISLCIFCIYILLSIPLSIWRTAITSTVDFHMLTKIKKIENVFIVLTGFPIWFFYGINYKRLKYLHLKSKSIIT